jgi:hypothetical protein
MIIYFLKLHMKMLKAIFVSAIILVSAPHVLLGQCDSNIEYTAKKRTESNYSIYLKSNVQVSGIKAQLYDLYQGKIVAEKIISISPASEIEVFTNVKPSVYTINLKIEGCEKARGLGGVNGINIGIR